VRVSHAYTEPLVRKTVTLPVSYVDQLAREGNGNLSDGLRFVLENVYTRTGVPWLLPSTPTAPER